MGNIQWNLKQRLAADNKLECQVAFNSILIKTFALISFTRVKPSNILKYKTNIS